VYLYLVPVSFKTSPLKILFHIRFCFFNNRDTLNQTRLLVCTSIPLRMSFRRTSVKLLHRNKLIHCPTPVFIGKKVKQGENVIWLFLKTNLSMKNFVERYPLIRLFKNNWITLSSCFTYEHLKDRGLFSLCFSRRLPSENLQILQREVFLRKQLLSKPFPQFSFRFLSLEKLTSNFFQDLRRSYPIFCWTFSWGPLDQWPPVRYYFSQSILTFYWASSP